MNDQPLRGYTVGVTAERKADEFAAMLTRRGAQVVQAAAIHTVPVPEDGDLAAEIGEILTKPVDYAVVTTGTGFRGLLDAARANGVGDQLQAHLAPAALLARGSKAVGAVRGAGLGVPWSAPSEQSVELLEYLKQQDLAGKRVVVQVHGDPMEDFRQQLAEAGAEVVPVTVYRWTDPVDVDALDRLIGVVVAGEVDALPFTSAPAAANLLDRADRIGQGEALRAAMRSTVVLACVGPVTAAPLERAGFSVVMPQRARTAALVNLLAEKLPARS